MTSGAGAAQIEAAAARARWLRRGSWLLAAALVGIATAIIADRSGLSPWIGAIDAALIVFIGVVLARRHPLSASLVAAHSSGAPGSRVWCALLKRTIRYSPAATRRDAAAVPRSLRSRPTPHRARHLPRSARFHTAAALSADAGTRGARRCRRGQRDARPLVIEGTRLAWSPRVTDARGTLQPRPSSWKIEHVSVVTHRRLAGCTSCSPRYTRGGTRRRCEWRAASVMRKSTLCAPKRGGRLLSVDERSAAVVTPDLRRCWRHLASPR